MPFRFFVLEKAQFFIQKLLLAPGFYILQYSFLLLHMPRRKKHISDLDFQKMSPSRFVGILMKNPDAARIFDEQELWLELYSGDWLKLLSKCPQYADRFKERAYARNKSGGADCPRNEDTFKMYADMDPWDWSSLLLVRPELAGLCDYCGAWAEFGAGEWTELLEKFPDWRGRAKKYKNAWVAGILENPDLAEECECLGEFDVVDWSFILEKYPEFAAKCDKFPEFESWLWSGLIEKQPSLWVYSPLACVEKIIEDPANAEECKCWDWFGDGHWHMLLKARPQFADRCGVYEKFSADDWYWLMLRRPEFRDRAKNYAHGCAALLAMRDIAACQCDKFAQFDAADWYMFCRARPHNIHICGEYGGWELFSPKRLCALAMEVPQGARGFLAEEFDKRGLWGRISKDIWLYALCSGGGHEFAEKCGKFGEFSEEEWGKLLKASQKFLPIAKEHENGWIRLLQDKPGLAGQCKMFPEFSADSWQLLLLAGAKFEKIAKNFAHGQYALLMSNPKFAAQCDKWDCFDASEWVEILKKYPQFEKKCKIWDKFDCGDWVDLLCGRRRFAKRCGKWGDFSAGQWECLILASAAYLKMCPNPAIISDDGWGRILMRRPELKPLCKKLGKYIPRYDSLLVY